MSAPEESFVPVFDETPARATLRPQTASGPWLGRAVEGLELISRGDIVNGVLVRAAEGSGGPSNGLRPALLLVAHDAGGSAQAPELRAVADWLGPTLGVVAIDLPLHGHRASPKLSERLIGAIAARARGGVLDPNGAVLVDEFMRQAETDWRRTLDAVLALERFDAKRIGFLGLGLGAWIGAHWLAGEMRVGAALLGGRRTAPMPATSSDRPPAAATEIGGLDLERSAEPWPTPARTFLGSRLGF